ncbi:hypothetical protein H7F15_06415 [Pontibacter sp. Tf4]|uniref:hypothetical protein n=1 Tax=Pontibacter sp. Tf4 TaxID=2761620 RepID=UPI001623A7FE|nr:hypothetical protein [Pontibacter sp. Tf4]MBB6610663.1 hypothetical protein [Pontibacter sp. Tf4]
MRKVKLFGLLVIPAMFTVGCSDDQDVTPSADLSASTAALATGNGAPSGSHYNLNIIGVSKGKTATMDGNSGHRIFVSLEGNTKILLAEGDTYQVLDANGTDSNGAKFQLPNPDPDNDGITEYSVWARALGKPGGSSTMSTCAYDPMSGEDVCSTESLVSVRSKGKSSFTNVSKDLLYIYADLDNDGDTERYPLFDDRLEDYYWSYDNNGLKILQLRFYEMATNVN